MVVVDDDSDDGAAVARVCGRPNVRLVRRDVNGGPGAARNEALGLVDSELVAFVDSDCRVTEGWLEGLLWWFDDPLVAAVAPRIRPDPERPAPRFGPGTPTPAQPWTWAPNRARSARTRWSATCPPPLWSLGGWP